MKQLIVVVKPFRAQAVLQAAAALGVSACAVREAKGYGRQKSYLERYAGSEYDFMYLPKVEITLWLEDDQVEEASSRIASIARTGRIGDGKIMILDLAWPALDF